MTEILAVISNVTSVIHVVTVWIAMFDVVVQTDMRQEDVAYSLVKLLAFLHIQPREC